MALADGPKPAVESESAANVTATDATLEARINPGSGEDGFSLATTYEFFLESPWCGTHGPGFCEASGGVLVYKGVIPAGSAPQLVSVNLASVEHALSPDTTYGYRVVATNEAGEAFGGEQTFTTLTTPPAGAPAIDSVSVSHLTSTDATLEAQINTEDEATLYEFLMWYSPCAECEDIAIFKLDLPFGLLTPSSLDQSVSLDLNSVGVTLRQGAEYGYSVIATNVDGSTEAQWKTFEPPVLDPPGPTVLPGPVGNEPEVPLSGGQHTTTGTPAAPALSGAGHTGTSSMTGVGKPKPKHGKHHKRKHHDTKAAKHPKGGQHKH
ncbi:MAG TPA: hypothetical protein VNY52_10955 [Solirubrobacteraceae bacterium]|nr:hypothetical protein [Solirubrobacteraceae bacterium]